MKSGSTWRILGTITLFLGSLTYYAGKDMEGDVGHDVTLAGMVGIGLGLALFVAGLVFDAKAGAKK